MSGKLTSLIIMLISLSISGFAFVWYVIKGAPHDHLIIISIPIAGVIFSLISSPVSASKIIETIANARMGKKEHEEN